MKGVRRLITNKNRNQYILLFLALACALVAILGVLMKSSTDGGSLVNCISAKFFFQSCWEELASYRDAFGANKGIYIFYLIIYIVNFAFFVISLLTVIGVGVYSVICLNKHKKVNWVNASWAIIASVMLYFTTTYYLNQGSYVVEATLDPVKTDILVLAYAYFSTLSWGALFCAFAIIFALMLYFSTQKYSHKNWFDYAIVIILVAICAFTFTKNLRVEYDDRPYSAALEKWVIHYSGNPLSPLAVLVYLDTRNSSALTSNALNASGPGFPVMATTWCVTATLVCLAILIAAIVLIYQIMNHKKGIYCFIPIGLILGLSIFLPFANMNGIYYFFYHLRRTATINLNGASYWNTQVFYALYVLVGISTLLTGARFYFKLKEEKYESSSI